MPYQHLLRKHRVSIPFAWYAITFRVRDYHDYFLNPEAAQVVMNTLLDQRHQRTECLVVMPDHVHWMLELDGKWTLSRVVQLAKMQSSQRVNRLFVRSGPVWQAGFYDRKVRNELERYKLSRYLIENPVRAGLVKTTEEYPHIYAEWLI